MFTLLIAKRNGFSIETFETRKAMTRRFDECVKQKVVAFVYESNNLVSSNVAVDL